MANRDYTITGPDGREIVINGPDNATPAQLRAAAEKAFGVTAAAPSAAPAPSMLDRFLGPEGGPEGSGLRNFYGKNLLMGAVRGAAGIGATVMQPFQALEDKITGRSGTNQATRAGIEGGIRETGADPGSLAFQGGKLGAEVAGTLGVGGALAAPLRAVPVAAPLANALASSGFTTGRAVAPNALARAADMGVRMAGGGVSGAASAGLVDPESAGAGGLIGAALPPALKAAALAGRPVGNALARVVQPREVVGAADIARALDASTPQELAALVTQLRSGENLVTSPTAAQALQSPGASILQRVIYDSPGGGALRDKIAAQAEARLAALERVAPTNAAGLAQARDDLGRTVERAVVPAEAEAGRRVSSLYESVDPFGETRVLLPLDEMQAARSKYLGPGTFGGGKSAAQAVDTAKQIGTLEIPAETAVKASREQTLLDAVKAAGGINQGSVSSKQLAGETRDLRQSGLGRVVYKNRGLSAERMAEKMHEAGFIPDEDPVTLYNALRENPRGVSAGFDQAESFAARADAARELRPAETIAKPVTFREVQNLRSSIGEKAEKASLKGNKREAAALNQMRAEIDARVEAAAAGKGDPQEFFPADIVQTWREANAAHAAKMERFHTGPQAGIFRKGGDGQPALQGGEVASAFWGNRPGLADDVRSFRRLVDDSPELLGQFKSLVTTHGAATADASGNLTSKFSKWVEQTLPGLREAFSPEEVATLQRIAADIDRATAAQKLGTSLGGSNTYQNAANALSLGVFDSPALTRAASMVPVVRGVSGPLLDTARDMARNAKAKRLAELLADSDASANAIEQLILARTKKPNALSRAAGPTLYRAAPQLGTSR